MHYRILPLAALLLVGSCAPHPDQPRVECLQNLHRISRLLRALEEEKGLEPRPGAEYLLQILPGLAEHEQSFLVCPLDPDRATTRCSYRGPDAAFLASEAADRSSPESRAKILACCACGDGGDEAWHPDGVCVVYVRGATRFIPWSELEGCEGGPVKIGPDSPDPRFRHLVR